VHLFDGIFDTFLQAESELRRIPRKRNPSTELLLIGILGSSF
jgi:hypothetical protein